MTYLDGLVEDLEGEELGIVVRAELQNLVDCHVRTLMALVLIEHAIGVLHLNI